MKKQITSLLLLLSFVSFSQEYESSTSHFNNFNSFKSWNFELFLTNQLSYQPAINNTLIYYGLGAYPRYSFFAPKDYFSIGIGTPFNLGIDAYGSNSSYYYQYFIDLPLELSLNVGDKATEFSEYWLGSSIGFGIDYNCSVYYNSFNELKAASNSLGPIVSFCLKYRYNEIPIGLRASYMWGVINDFKKDPSIIYANQSDVPKILTLSLAYGVQ